jgi:hypothetical protein
MSATKGLKSEIRHAHDEYISPPRAVRRFFERYPFPTGATLFDPCASRGSLITAAATVRTDLKWLANELNPTCAEELRKIVPNAVFFDFLTLPVSEEPSSDITIVTNPPYSLAELFIEHGLKIAKVSAWLLRLNFLGGGRNEFHRRHTPGIFVSPNRPSLNGWGSDACEYGWFVYGDPAVSGRIFYLDETPAEEIEVWNASARKMYPEDNPKFKKEIARRQKLMESPFLPRRL